MHQYHDAVCVLLWRLHAVYYLIYFCLPLSFVTCSLSSFCTLYSSSAFWLYFSPKWSVWKSILLALPAWAAHFIAVKPSLRFGGNREQRGGGGVRDWGWRWGETHTQREMMVQAQLDCCSTWVLLYWANHLVEWRGPIPCLPDWREGCVLWWWGALGHELGVYSNSQINGLLDWWPHSSSIIQMECASERCCLCMCAWKLSYFAGSEELMKF